MVCGVYWPVLPSLRGGGNIDMGKKVCIVTLEKHCRMPLCPRCGMTLWDKSCGRCKALPPVTVKPPMRISQMVFVLGVLTGRITPTEPEV